MWVSDASTANPHVVFCFTHHTVSLRGHQIHPNNGTCLLSNWKICGSNKPEVWEVEKSFSNAFEKGKAKYFDINLPFYQCFKIEITEKSQCGSYQTDIRWLELYGSIKRIDPLTCSFPKRSVNFLATLITFFILS